jgi:hypothetical protein
VKFNYFSPKNKSERVFCKIIGIISNLTDEHLKELIDFLIEIKYRRNAKNGNT